MALIGKDDELKWTPVTSAPVAAPRNALSAGLSSGLDQLQGLGYAGLGALSRAAGLEGVANWADRGVQQNDLEAYLNGRPDLENIEDQSLSSAPGYLGYQVAKQVPILAGTLAASAVIPEAAIPAALSRGLGYLPKAVGGGGLKAGMNFAERRAALEAGNQFARIGAASYPMSAGSLYQEAVERGDPSQGDALAALAGGVPYAATEAVMPAAVARGLGVGGLGFKGGLGTRMLKAAGVAGLGEAGTELAQNEMEMGFAGPLTDEQKFSRRLNSAVAGGLVGGTFGSVAGIRRPPVVPNQTRDLLNDTSNGLAGQPDLPLTYAAEDNISTRGIRNPYNTAGFVDAYNQGNVAYMGDPQGDLFGQQLDAVPSMLGYTRDLLGDPLSYPVSFEQQTEAAPIRNRRQMELGLEGNEAPPVLYGSGQTAAQFASLPITDDVRPTEVQQQEAAINQIKTVAGLKSFADQALAENRLTPDQHVEFFNTIDQNGRMNLAAKRTYLNQLIQENQNGTQTAPAGRQEGTQQAGFPQSTGLAREEGIQSGTPQGGGTVLQGRQGQEGLLNNAAKAAKTVAIPENLVSRKVTELRKVLDSVRAETGPSIATEMSDDQLTQLIREKGIAAADTTIASMKEHVAWVKKLRNYDTKGKKGNNANQTAEAPVPALQEEAQPVAGVSGQKQLTPLQQRSLFGKSLGAVVTAGGHYLSGRRNPRAATAIANRDTRAVLQALATSKNHVTRWLAEQARAIPGLKFDIDENASEDRDVQSRTGLDTAKMLLSTLDAVRQATPLVEKSDDRFGLPSEVGNIPVQLWDNGEPVETTLGRILSDSGVRSKAAFKTFAENAEADVAYHGEDHLRRVTTVGRRVGAVAGKYSAEDNRISVASEHAASDEKVISHELTHALTIKALMNPTPAQRPIVRKLEKLHEHVKSVLGERDYGTQDVYEFVAEGLGNPDFQEKLNNIPYQGETAWGKFAQFVADLLGVKRDSAFMELLALSEQLISGEETNAAQPQQVAQETTQEGDEESTAERLKKAIPDEKHRAIIYDALGLDEDGHAVNDPLRGEALAEKHGVSPARISQILKQYGLNAKKADAMARVSSDVSDEIADDLNAANAEETTESGAAQAGLRTQKGKGAKSKVESSNDPKAGNAYTGQLKKAKANGSYQKTEAAWDKVSDTPFDDLGPGQKLWAIMQMRDAGKLTKIDAANITEGPKFSSSETTESSTTVDGVYKALSEWFFSKQKMGQIVSVVQHWDELPASVRNDERMARSANPETVQGFVLDGKVYLIADNIDKGSERSVFMHEVGAHIGLTEEEESDFANAVLSWKDMAEGSLERKVYDATMLRLKSAGESADNLSEIVAYATEEAVKAGATPTMVSKIGRWLKELAGAILRLISTKLAAGRPLTVQDLVDYTYGAAGIALDELGGKEGSGLSVSDKVLVNGVKRPVVNSNGQLIHPTLNGVRNFWKWFGESKVVDSDGRPLVVYHGTHADITEFKKTKGAHIGFHFGDKEAANTRLEDTADGRVDTAEVDRLNARSEAFFKGLRLFEEGLRKKDTEVPSDELLAALESGADIGVVFDKYRYQPTEEENAELLRLRQQYDDSKLPIVKTGEGSNIGAFYLKIDAPVRTPDVGNWGSAKEVKAVLPWESDARSIGQLVEDIKAHGKDGFVYANRVENPVMHADSYIVLDPTQIKSATGNVGQFDPANPDIRFSKKSTTEQIIEKLPVQMQEPVQVAADIASDYVQRAMSQLAFTNTLVELGKEVLPAAKTFIDAINKKMVEMTRREKRVADIGAEFTRLKTAAFNEAWTLGRDMRVKGAWAYQPTWLKREVKVDPEMAARWEKLQATNPEAAKLLDQAFQYGEETHGDIKQILEDELNEKYPGDDPKAKEMRDMMRRKLPAVDGPYLPLRRVGSHVFFGKSQAYMDAEANNDTKLMAELKQDEKHFNFKMFDSYAEAKAYKRQNEARYAESEAYTKKQFFNEVNSLPADAFEKIKQMASTMDSDAAKKVIALANELYLTSLAETSARKSELRASGAAGMDANDMFRAFISKGRADAQYIAALKDGREVSKAFGEMSVQADRADDRDKATRVYNALAERYAKTFEVAHSPVLERMMGLTSIWMLLTKPAYYLYNATQVALMTHPYLAQRFGAKKSYTALRDAYMAYFKGKNVLKPGVMDLSGLSPRHQQLVEELTNRGKTDITITQELGDLAHMGKGVIGKAMSNAGIMLRGAVQKAETLNRIVSGIAAYELATKNGMSHAKAVEYAAEVIDNTQGDYTGFNAPALFNKNALTRLISQYRKIQILQATFFIRSVSEATKGSTPTERWAATRMLRYTLAHHAVLAGGLGLPLMNIFSFLFAASGDDDEPRDLELWMREGIDNETMGRLLTRGVPAALGLDISKNVGMAGAAQVTGRDFDLTSRAGFEKTVFGLLGPAVGLGAQAAGAMETIGRGDYYKGLEQLAPGGIRTTMQAMREAAQGQTNTKDDVLVTPDEINLAETAFKAMGFKLSSDAYRSLVRSKKYEFEQHFNDLGKLLKKEYTEAYRDGDSEAMGDVLERWQSMTESMRDYGFKPPKRESLLKAPMEQAKRERETANGVQFNKRSEGFVRQATQ